nr:putative pentatricopeptide repeat-containing protein At5g37570 isoform X1 [Ipomoea batatas]
MKTILSSETMDIPDGVKIKVKAKEIEVEGPRGKLVRNFKHLNLDFQLITDEATGKRKLKVDAWFGSRKTTAAIRTALSHVENLITGVTKGYRYKMRFVYAHFPINASITNSNKGIEIRNFLGEKKVRKVEMLEGVTVLRSEKVKDELVLDGNDIELVSRSCALINQKCHVKNKDIRKFLDGIYPLSSSSMSVPAICAASSQIVNLLRACTSIRNLKQVHTHIICKGFEQNHIIITQFISHCNSFSSSVAYATGVFERVLQPNIYLWNSLIKGHSEQSSLAQSLSLFNQMKKCLDVVPDGYTLTSLIKACSNVLALRDGQAVHGLVVRYGTDNNVFVGSTLIDFYGKCKEIECARRLFDEMPVRNEVSWTAIIVGYVNIGDFLEAQKLFNEMPKKNLVSWNVMISAFVKFGDLNTAKRLFDGMPERNVVSFTTMIDGFAKAGDMVSARFLFDQSSERDIVSWSAMISGYAQNGQPDEAVKLFFEMMSLHCRPDEFVMVSLMSACSQIGCLDLARRVDSYIKQSSFDLHQPHVAAALVDMNAKCGNMDRAMTLFEEIPKHDVILYCSLMQALSVHGRGEEAVGLFDRMLGEGLVPDGVAFTVILTACSRGGLVEEGFHFFDSMIKEYSLKPSPDHYACMVDLLGRSGKLKAAYNLIRAMPIETYAGASGALLGACKLHSDIELGEEIARKLFELEPLNAGNYVLLSDIYAAADRWLDVSYLRDKMCERGIRKIPGRSWV